MSEVEFLPDREMITSSINLVIDKQSEDEPVLLVVAYWGRGAEDILQLGKSFKIVCNLTDGGTNPQVIKDIAQRRGIKVELHNMPNLHAKVVIGVAGAVISSSNMSDNGLQIRSQNGNLEAGIYIGRHGDEYDEIRSWGWKCWIDSEEITPAMLDDALSNYQLRPLGVAFPHEAEEGCIADEINNRGEYLFSESDLFLSERESNRENMIRTASKSLKCSHRNMLGREISKREAWVTAYIANLLWTHAGHSMDWKGGSFRFPSDVVERWRDKNVANDDVRELLKWIAKDDSIAPSIRECAKDIDGKFWDQYVEFE